MTYNEFEVYVKENIKWYLPEEYQDAEVSVKNIKKNNGLVLKGLMIKKEGESITPTIYLEDFYEKYMEDEEMKPIENTIMEIAEMRKKADVDDKNKFARVLSDFEKVKNNIFPRLIGKEEWNEEYKEYRPYKIWNDLMIVYAIEIPEVSGAAQISNSLIKSWNMTVDDIHDLAMENMKKYEKIEFKGMFETLKELNQNTALIPEEEEMDFMRVLTNERKIYGATMALNREILDKIYEKLGAFIMIPSSVHEWIVLKLTDETDMKEIENMIKTINKSQVEKKEWLSDHPYICRGAEEFEY